MSTMHVHVHAVTIILALHGEQDIASADFSSGSSYMKYWDICHHHHFKQSLRLCHYIYPM